MHVKCDYIEILFSKLLDILSDILRIQNCRTPGYYTVYTEQLDWFINCLFGYIMICMLICFKLYIEKDLRRLLGTTEHITFPV